MNRIHALRRVLEHKRLDGFVVTNLTHIRYLTNFSGSNALLLVLPNALHLFTDGRYAEQIKTELYPLAGLRTHITRTTWMYVQEQMLVAGTHRLGFDASAMSYAAVRTMRKHCRPTRFVPCRQILEPLMMVKTPEEVSHIKAAADIAAEVYNVVLEIVKPGISEHDLAAELSYQARKRGSEGDAFDIIVASGVRGALPHGRASKKILQRGELVTIDFGCRVQGFHSDMTRTFALGKPNDFDASIYALVLEANTRAIDQARAGLTCKSLDAVARDIISAAGYGEAFEHSLGHGLGLDVHEPPTVSWRFPRVRLPEGAVITIEPGVYVPNRCGVRIEDDVWLRADGCEVLTHSPKELIIV
jgi:Xaa-Pro aminopeptidase